ncbi:MAG: DUF2304 domain-containing protein [Atopobiaceae bacterium]|nr:DUF2304 domain-containing protein [Atopobiaceae bacterium]
MSLMLRILCVSGSLVTLLFITSNIRRRKVQIEDSIFWVLLAVALLVVAVFPGIASVASQLLGFQAPSNFVFVVVIAILLAKLFSLSTEVSSLKHRLNELAQEEALLSQEEEENNSARQA